MWISGIPDIRVLSEGKSYDIELKVGKNKATMKQSYTLLTIIKAGGTAGVCYSVDDVKLVMAGVNLLDKSRVARGGYTI